MSGTVGLRGRPSTSNRCGALMALISIVAFAVTVVGGCSSGGDANQDPVPVVDQIGDALRAVSDRYPEPPALFEVSANLLDVRIVVAEDWNDGAGTAKSYSFRDGVLSDPTELGQGQGNVFFADVVDFDESKLFDRVRDDLPGSLLTDFAVTGGPDGSVIYDATLRSESGGQLRVRLGGDGTVLEVMAE